MSDNDLIRRGDAIAALTELPVFSEFMSDALNGNAVLMIHKATTAINTIPAAHPTVKPGEIERAVWGAMGWALRHAKQMPGGIIPAYTDTGNSDAEVECRRSAARILSALDMQPTVSPDVAALAKALFIARVHVANNAQGWSVGRGAARDDLAIVDAALARVTTLEMDESLALEVLQDD